jgi:hypothetical protein
MNGIGGRCRRFFPGRPLSIKLAALLLLKIKINLEGGFLNFVFLHERIEASVRVVVDDAVGQGLGRDYRGRQDVVDRVHVSFRTQVVVVVEFGGQPFAVRLFGVVVEVSGRRQVRPVVFEVVRQIEEETVGLLRYDVVVGAVRVGKRVVGVVEARVHRDGRGVAVCPVGFRRYFGRFSEEHYYHRDVIRRSSFFRKVGQTFTYEVGLVWLPTVSR